MNRFRTTYRVLIPICGLLSFLGSISAQVEQAWFARYNGPTNGWDSAVAVALGADGSVHVTGSSEGSPGNLDYVIAKFTPDGDSVWASRYNGTGNGNDAPAGIQVDPNGNVYVTGASRGAASGDDITTVKSDANGNQLWASRYTTSGNKSDAAAALALDSAGNVYVTGSAGTVKYVQQATPPLRLEVKAGSTNRLIQSSVAGQAGRFYAVEASTNLANWITITNLVNATGTASFVDPAQGTLPVRFYRAFKEF